ncbi:hypothetical protein Hanom_Chr05g00393541 [Helianthus anomalus]
MQAAIPQRYQVPLQRHQFPAREHLIRQSRPEPLTLEELYDRMESRHEESIAGQRRIEDGMKVIMDHFHLQPPLSWQPQQEDPAGGQQGGAGGA